MVSGSTDSSKMKPALKKDLLMILPDPDSAYPFIMIWFFSYSPLKGKVIREKGFIRHIALRSLSTIILNCCILSIAYYLLLHIIYYYP